MIQCCDVNAAAGGRWNATFSGWMWSIPPFNLNGKEENNAPRGPQALGKYIFLTYCLFLTLPRINKVFLILIWFWRACASTRIERISVLCVSRKKISFRKSLGKKGNGNAWASYWILLTSLFGTEPQVQQCSQITACCFGSIKSLSQAENMSKQIAAVSLRLKHEHEVKKKKRKVVVGIQSTWVWFRLNCY